MQRGGGEALLAQAWRIQAADRQGVFAQAMAVFQQDQVLVLELVGRHAQPATEVMAFGKRRHQLVVADEGGLQARGLVGQGDHRRVQGAGLQRRDQPVGQVLAQEEAELGVALAQKR